jgi:hypothetical protein
MAFLEAVLKVVLKVVLWGDEMVAMMVAQKVF